MEPPLLRSGKNKDISGFQLFYSKFSHKSNNKKSGVFLVFFTGIVDIFIFLPDTDTLHEMLLFSMAAEHR